MFPIFSSIERFSSFLRNTPNQRLTQVKGVLVQTLMQERVITARIVALGSTPIPANVKENNLKTSIKDKFDKVFCSQFPRQLS